MFIDFKSDAAIFAAIRVVSGALDQRDVFAIHGAIAEARACQDDRPIFDVARRLDDDERLDTREVETLQAMRARSAPPGWPCSRRARGCGSRPISARPRS
jgi:hypothetical protein